MALPGALGSVKQRRSTDSASNSEGEDMEDDASSMVRLSLRARNPWEVVQCFVWLFLVVYIVYMGDRESNLISLLWTDDRVIRGIRKTGKRFSYALWPVWRFLAIPLTSTFHPQ
ncbi:hypothetical protein QJS10_CPA10g00326 [Acorus calamus]|uniref:Transmembrane protein n=1 Tax=Acorus calamus TaxID=4465 RepID=A0AAV9DZ49_ACOCL|nr:hypothetical protein QJS10_CPA10g00326 [Acorus calamus]